MDYEIELNKHNFLLTQRIYFVLSTPPPPHRFLYSNYKILNSSNENFSPLHQFLYPDFPICVCYYVVTIDTKTVRAFGTRGSKLNADCTLGGGGCGRIDQMHFLQVYFIAFYTLGNYISSLFLQKLLAKRATDKVQFS